MLTALGQMTVAYLILLAVSVPQFATIYLVTRKVDELWFGGLLIGWTITGAALVLTGQWLEIGWAQWVGALLMMPLLCLCITVLILGFGVGPVYLLLARHRQPR